MKKKKKTKKTKKITEILSDLIHVNLAHAVVSIVTKAPADISRNKATYPDQILDIVLRRVLQEFAYISFDIERMLLGEVRIPRPPKPVAKKSRWSSRKLLTGEKGRV